MSKRNLEDLRRELDRLMREQVEGLKKQTFGGLAPEELHELEVRLKRIRELSADYLMAMKRRLDESPPANETTTTNKPNVTLPGMVERVIENKDPDQPEKAQISVDGADTLYKEIRIENVLQDENGKNVRLKEGAKVDVTVEADKDATEPKNKS